MSKIAPVVLLEHGKVECTVHIVDRGMNPPAEQEPSPQRRCNLGLRALSLWLDAVQGKPTAPSILSC